MVLELVKQLRATTHAPVALCREAALHADGDLAQAHAYLDQHWRQPKPKAAGEAAGQIYTYVHQGRVGVMVDLRCATDFVARTDQFQDLCKEIALQVAAGLDEDDLLAQPSIRNLKQSVQQVLDGVSRQVNEVITIKRTVRWSLADL